MKSLGAGCSTADDWGYEFPLLIGHLRSLVDHELEGTNKKRLKFAERAEAALLELEQIEIDME